MLFFATDMLMTTKSLHSIPTPHSSSAPVPTLMVDVAGTRLQTEDNLVLAHPQVAGVILFGRNVDTPVQVRQLTDDIRTLNPNLIIAVDQEGGRVARLRTGFTSLPAMGVLGKMYDDNPSYAQALAYCVGYVMACEVLAVGIDLSFAPVLDIDNGSLVIGDRAFHHNPQVATVLAAALIDGMNKAGMGATGKHFPGHGSVVPDSHVANVCDERCFDELWATDTQVFVQNLGKLAALMPAHVVFNQVDDKPAGFSKIWLQDIIRTKLGFDGVLFSDDLSMKAAHVAGGAAERVRAALQAGCDVALLCNDRAGVLSVLQADLPRLDTFRFGRMKAVIPSWQGNLQDTCGAFFEDYAYAKAQLVQAFG